MLRQEMFKNLAQAPDENARILLLTYNDINGISVGTLLRRIYDNVTIEKCNNANMKSLIRKTVSSPDQTTLISYLSQVYTAAKRLPKQ